MLPRERIGRNAARVESLATSTTWLIRGPTDSHADGGVASAFRDDARP